MSLRFFIDHCVPTSVASALSSAGHDVLRLKDYLPTDSPDPAVIDKAQERGAILLSLNGDFADIVSYPPAHYKVIVALQVGNHPEVMLQVVARLQGYLAAHPDAPHYHGKLFIVEAHRVRVRS